MLTSSLPLAKNLLQRAESIELSSAEKTRYARHLLLPEVGETGQRSLKAAKVLIVGAGGLGSPVGLYLAAAGVGQIGIVDFDLVDLTNLQRQVVFDGADVGKLKAESAARKLRHLNESIDIVPYNQRLSPENIQSIFAAFDIIVDGTDNFSTRYLINDAAVLTGKPVVYGSIFRFDGQVSLFFSPFGPCYRCLFPKAPPPEHVPNCAEGGVLGVLPGVVGVMQATETLKLITGVGECLIGRLLTYDAALMKYGEFSFKKDPECAVCGSSATIKTIEESVVTCERRSIQLASDLEEISVDEFEGLRNQGMQVKIVDVRSAQERDICSIPGSIHLPLAEVAIESPELQGSEKIVFHCKSGLRSLTATRQLRTAGRQGVFSLKGGIIAWLRATNSNQATY